ncbi:phBC6A51 family helix-turn-helix protein [Metabacillus idriensis]|nr:phBC6A51 family helix-turn-helix protein [Metabacillus idriensis]
MEKEKTIHDIPVPAGIDARQVTIAKDYVTNRLSEGFTLNSLFQKHSISSKTWYEWLEKPEFNTFVNEMADVLIPQDELAAVKKMKKKILSFADKASVSTSEMKMFTEVFGYVFAADARLQAEKLGLNKEGTTSTDTHRTVEEKKAALLARLRS